MSHESVVKSVRLESDGVEVGDVEIWGRGPRGSWPRGLHDRYVRRGGYISYHGLPVYLVNHCGLPVYSGNGATEEWFRRELVAKAVKLHPDVAMVFVNEDTCLVFYYDTQVKCTIVDFSTWGSINRWIGSGSVSPQKPVVDTKIFDRVLLQKKSKSNPFLEPAKPSNDTTRLVSQDQINHAVQKIILSGLRIRGLSPNLSHMVNDKLTVKEIYQMTYKATVFSLRKYNYSFNKTTHPITVDELQDIVEKLLEIFVDVA